MHKEINFIDLSLSEFNIHYFNFSTLKLKNNQVKSRKKEIKYLKGY